MSTSPSNFSEYLFEVRVEVGKVLGDIGTTTRSTQVRLLIRGPGGLDNFLAGVAAQIEAAILPFHEQMFTPGRCHASQHDDEEVNK